MDFKSFRNLGLQLQGPELYSILKWFTDYFPIFFINHKHNIKPITRIEKVNGASNQSHFNISKTKKNTIKKLRLVERCSDLYVK